jgi:hypothetical protein
MDEVDIVGVMPTVLRDFDRTLSSVSVTVQELHEEFVESNDVVEGDSRTRLWLMMVTLLLQ